VILILTALIAIVVIVAVWNLSLKIRFALVLSGSFDPSDYSAFQAGVRMIFTVIIALEFKKSLLVVGGAQGQGRPDPGGGGDRASGRLPKGLILDLAETDAWHILSLAAAILALGGVYWPHSGSRPGRRMRPDERDYGTAIFEGGVPSGASDVLLMPTSAGRDEAITIHVTGLNDARHGFPADIAHRLLRSSLRGDAGRMARRSARSA